MTSPESPLDKKGTVEERTLTVEERISRLEFTLERAYNVLGKELSKLEMTTAENFGTLHGEVTQAVHVLNASNLQNILTIKELTKMLGKAKVIDEKVLEANVAEQAKIAIARQQEYLQMLQAEALKANETVTTSPEVTA